MFSPINFKESWFVTFFYYYQNVINCFNRWLSSDPNLCSWALVNDSWIQNEIFLVLFNKRVVDLCQLLNAWFLESFELWITVPSMMWEPIPRNGYTFVGSMFLFGSLWMITESILRPRVLISQVLRNIYGQRIQMKEDSTWKGRELTGCLV